MSTSDAGKELARSRWDSPENVEKRVQALAARVKRIVDTLPPLSEAQQAKIAAAARIGGASE
jgi:hypothetical protein